MCFYDVLIVGGGAAGLTAAYTLCEHDPEIKVVLAERAEYLGGVLRQCTHRGFGLGYFNEDLTGQEYADRLEKRLRETSAEIRLNTEAVQIEVPDTEETTEKVVLLAGPDGNEKVRFRILILATGCRERAIGSMGISGTRPSGIFGAGQLQRMLNLGNYYPGEQAVVYGSGDIGLIVARELILNGTHVKCILEKQSKSPAMERNRRQCLEAYQIPLQVDTEVVELHGTGRLKGVTVRNIRSGTEAFVPCDTLVIAAGLIPERTLLEELNLQERASWLYLCGNCEYIHPIVDRVSMEAEQKALELLNLYHEKGGY